MTSKIQAEIDPAEPLSDAEKTQQLDLVRANSLEEITRRLLSIYIRQILQLMYLRVKFIFTHLMISKQIIVLMMMVTILL